MRPRPSAIRWIVGTSLRLRYLVVAAAVAMMVFGIATLPGQRVDVFPEFAPPRVVIQTACLGLSTSDVEQLVTVPLEQALRGVPGVDRPEVEVGAPAVVDRDALHARHRPAAGP